MSQLFNFDAALKALQFGRCLTGKDGVLILLIQQLTEAALAAKLDTQLAQELKATRRNGATKKALRPRPVIFTLQHLAIATALEIRNW